MTTLMSIDSGTQAAGWAVFEKGMLKASGVFEEEGRSWWQRSDDIVSSLVDHVVIMGATVVVIEEPQQYSGGSKRARGAKGSDSILKLFAMAHTLRYVLEARGIEVHMVKPTTWKGQVPKQVTRSRMEKRWERTFGELDDETDAVGLGTWWLEKRERKKRRKRRR